MDIPSIIGRYKKTGLFTHAFVARGRLSQASPDFVYKDLPDGAEVFDLASLTKALVTTPLAFWWRNQNSLSFSASVGDWLGDSFMELDARLKKLTLRDLLAHTSGLPAWRNFWICRLSEAVAPTQQDVYEHILAVLRRAADAISGSKTSVYSDVGFVLLGAVLEKLAKKPLDSLFTDVCTSALAFDLSKNAIGFPRSSPHLGSFISTGKCLIRGRQLRGEVHDENCAALGGASGHAGLFGSGEAVCAFIHALASSPTGKTVLAENAAARQLRLGAPANEALVGWRQATTATSLPFGQGAAMGHMGFTGVAFWVWPEAGEYVTLLTNRVISGRVTPAIAELRREVFTALAAL